MALGCKLKAQWILNDFEAITSARSCCTLILDLSSDSQKLKEGPGSIELPRNHAFRQLHVRELLCLKAIYPLLFLRNLKES